VSVVLFSSCGSVSSDLQAVSVTNNTGRSVNNRCRDASLFVVFWCNFLLFTYPRRNSSALCTTPSVRPNPKGYVL
jgi:hypothetical protein